MITEHQRLAYLEAMGIQAWRHRAHSDSELALETDSPGMVDEVSVSGNTKTSANPFSSPFEIGPGSGEVLLLCQERSEAASRLASDIARFLGDMPVWGWLAAENSEGSTRLEQAIKDRLFTRVIVFTDSQHSEDEISEVLGSARIVLAPSFQTLSGDPANKKALWVKLCRNGWTANRG